MASERAGTDENGDEGIVWETPYTPINANDYLFVGGKRLVRPYFFEFLAHVKRRWDGKNIIDLFAGEFRQRPREYYVKAVQCGRIRVDGKRISGTEIVKDSQKVSHYLHRHEPPVLADAVTILEESSDVITVCKPPSVPVHSCGQYRKNTVLGLLEAAHPKLGSLYPVHRLDRLVSGLLILARNSETANRFRQEIEGRQVQKQYVAKVRGVFPAGLVETHAEIMYDQREGVSSIVNSNSTTEGKGKEACTRFQRISSDGVFSIVQCEPVTGRTHQIRVHLQHLGHPIANDALYLQETPAKRSRADKVAQSVKLRELALISEQMVSCGGKPARNVQECEGSVQSSEMNASTSETSVMQASGGNKTEDCWKRNAVDSHDSTTKCISLEDCPRQSAEFYLDPLCTNCPNLEPSGYEEEEEGLWLHCICYSSHSWEYRCPFPRWAL